MNQKHTTTRIERDAPKGPVIPSEVEESLSDSAGNHTVRDYYVYILTNVSRTLYIGVTSNLEARVDAHKRKLSPGFTRDYNLTMLVYVETFNEPNTAIAREKQLKNWSRAKKLALIERTNSEWRDLSADWLSGDADANPSQ